MPTPSSTGYLCPPKLVSATKDRKYWTNGWGSAISRIHRDIETRIYRCPWKDSAPVPANPLNPDGLSPIGSQVGEWQCSHYGFDGKYDVPMSRVYEEVWEKKGPWVQEEE